MGGFILGLIIGGCIGAAAMTFIIAASREEREDITLNYYEMSPDHQRMVDELVSDAKKEVEE